MLRIFGFVAAIFVVAALVGWLLTGAPSFHECDANYNKHYANNESGRPEPSGERTFSDWLPIYAQCAGEFVQVHNGAIQAASALVVACLTAILGGVAWSQLSRTQQIERAYIVGGGTVVTDETGQRYFRVDIANYGKTPAYVFDFGVEFDLLRNIERGPKEVRRSFRYDDQIPPGGIKNAIKFIRIPQRVEGVDIAYGQFWYEDIWHKNHEFRFILTLYPTFSFPDVSGVHKDYRKWT